VPLEDYFATASGAHVAVVVSLDDRRPAHRLLAWLASPWRMRAAERRLRRSGATPIGRFGLWPNAVQPTFIYPLRTAAAQYAEAELLPELPSSLRWITRAVSQLGLCHPGLAAIAVVGRRR
jgi:hypothetical protein